MIHGGSATRTRTQDDRRNKRAKRRLMIRFGEGQAEKTGFTRNISETGLMVHTNAVYKPGTTLHVEVHFPERTFVFWAKVMWAKKVPAQLAHVLDCGMGLLFMEPDPEWTRFWADWARHNLE